MALNKVMLIGNVGADPEVRYWEGGTGSSKVASIRLATTERYTSRSGEQRETTEWHNITAWRNLADLAEKYIKKGSQIYVEGRLRTREYTDQNGAKRYRTEIQADNIQLLGRRSDSQDGYQQTAPAQQGWSQQPSQPSQQSWQQPASRPAAPVQQPAAAPAPDMPAGPDDDLPF